MVPETAARAAEMVRVALVSPYSFDHVGGVQSHVMELANRLADEGDEVVVVGPGAVTGPSPAYTHISIGGSVGVKANGAVAPIALHPNAARRVRRAAAAADVIHVHEPLMPLAGWAALRGPARVLTFHADPSRLVRRSYAIAAPVLRRLVRQAAVTAVSELAASAVRPFAPEVTIVPNGIETSQYDIDTARIGGRVTFLGRDDRRKGLDVLLAAWPRIRAAVPTATLVVLGAAGVDRDGISFLGRVDDATKMKELATSEIFCAPNRGGESFGITLVEGLAAGNAVVASDLAAFRAVAGDAARFVAVDDPAALAATVIDLLQDPLAVDRLRTDGIRRAQRYDWSAVVPAYRNLYDRVRTVHHR